MNLSEIASLKNPVTLPTSSLDTCYIVIFRCCLLKEYCISQTTGLYSEATLEIVMMKILLFTGMLSTLINFGNLVISVIFFFTGHFHDL